MGVIVITLFAHVFNVVGVARTIDMSIMSIFCFIFDMSRIYSNTSSFFFRCRIYVRIKVRFAELPSFYLTVRDSYPSYGYLYNS